MRAYTHMQKLTCTHAERAGALYVLYVAVAVPSLHSSPQYFESDDPDLYVSKIEYIRDSDVTDLDLVFAEEEFRPGVATPRVSDGGGGGGTEREK